MAETSSRTIRFRAFRDDEADVCIAKSDTDRITAEAGSKQELIDRLTVIVPDVLESRNTRMGRVTIQIDLQEMRTIDQTEFAVA